MTKRLIALTITAAALLALPAPVSASDRSVYEAWSSRDAEGAKIGKRWKSAQRRYERSGGSVWKPLYRANKSFVKYTAEVEAAVGGEAASSERGATVRADALEALRLNRLSYTNLGKGLRLEAQDRTDSAEKLFARSKRQERSGLRALKRAKRGFKALGFGS